MSWPEFYVDRLSSSEEKTQIKKPFINDENAIDFEDIKNNNLSNEARIISGKFEDLEKYIMENMNNISHNAL